MCKKQGFATKKKKEKTNELFNYLVVKHWNKIEGIMLHDIKKLEVTDTQK